MKRALFIFCGFCWLGFAAGTGIIAWPYLADGAGGNLGVLSLILGPVSSVSVLLGLVHLVGFIALILVFFAVGLNLLLRGLFPKPNVPSKNVNTRIPYE
jgi:hypothetical protein